MGESRKRIDFFPCDPFSATQFIGGLCHEQTAGHVLEVGHHVVLHLRRTTEFPPVSSSTQDVGSLGEVFHPSCDNRAGLTKHDHLSTGHDGLDARAANSRERQHWNFLGNARLQTGVACTVDRLRTGLEGVTHHHVVHRFRRSPCFFECTLYRCCAQVLGAHGFQRSTGFPVASLSANPFTKRCASTAHNDHIVAHVEFVSHSGYEPHPSAG